MSNFHAKTRNPKTGKVETAEWIDDYFGKHRYGVRFPSEPDHVYREGEIHKRSRGDNEAVS